MSSLASKASKIGSASRVAGILSMMLGSGFPLEEALAMTEGAIADETAAGKVQGIREALEVIRRTRPDVLITDIRIPYLDGLSLIESAQEFLTGCDYIIISAYQEFSYARRALYLGALDYIDKPVTKDKLRDAFARLSQRREGSRRTVREGDTVEPLPDLVQHAEGTKNETIAGILAYLGKNYQQDIGLSFP